SARVVNSRVHSVGTVDGVVVVVMRLLLFLSSLTETCESLLPVYLTEDDNTSCERTIFANVDGQKEHKLIVSPCVFAFCFLAFRNAAASDRYANASRGDHKSHCPKRIM